MINEPEIGIEGLSGQVALVTGSSRGIGRAAAEELARYGAAVVITSRQRKDAERVAAEITETHGARTLGLEVDVADRDQVGACIEALANWGGDRLDIVVNNAGFPVDVARWNTPLHEIPADELAQWFRAVYETDLQGSRNVTHAALPMMVSKRAGVFVYLSSTPALSGHKATAYTEAKAGILGLMRDVAREYGQYNIRANALAPGNIRTGWFEKLSQAEQQTLAAEAPLGRWGEPHEVGKAILFLASPLSSFITGQTLVIDGGVVSH